MSTPLPTEYKIIDVVCNLLKTQLDLDDAHVWIYNQKADIPREPGLFIEVAFIASRPFGVSSYCGDDDAGNFCEFQNVQMQETYTVVLYSRDESALTRAWEAHLALSGVLSQQAQETYCFKLAQLPTSFTDTSRVEAAARLFRLDLTFNAIRGYSKIRVISYFDKFNIPPEIHTNQ